MRLQTSRPRWAFCPLLSRRGRNIPRQAWCLLPFTWKLLCAPTSLTMGAPWVSPLPCHQDG